MYIPIIAFNKFIQSITDFVWAIHLTAEQQEVIQEKSIKILENNKSQKRVTIFKYLFPLNGHTDDYFYQRISEFKNAEYASVNTALMIDAFKVLSVVLPPKIQKFGLKGDKLGYVMLQLFIEKDLKTWDGIDEDFRLYNHNDNSLKSINHDKIATIKRYIKDFKDAKRQSKTTQPFLFQEDSINESMSNKTELDIRKSIVDFYYNLSIPNLGDAWELLAPSYRNKCYKDLFENFEIGYRYTRSTDKVHIWDTNVHGDTAECNVFYEDTLTTFTTDELIGLESLKIGKLDDFVSKMKTLIDLASKTNLIGFEKIEIQKFFEPAVSEYIWYKCGRNPELIQELLPDERNITIPRLYKIAVMKIEEKWLLRGFLPLTARMIR